MARDIPKLKGRRNFNCWEQAIRPALDERNLWDYVDGKNPKPPGPAFGDVINTRVEFYMDAEWSLSDWIKKDREAIQQITSTVPGWMINTLNTAQRETSKAMFDGLCKRYKDGRYDRVIRWKNLRWDGSSDMSDFLNEWSAALAECLDNGDTITLLSQASQLAYAVRNKENKDVDGWAAAVSENCSMNTVSPLHELLEELIGVVEKRAKGGVAIL